MGAMDPIQGWHSDNYGARQPAPTVVTTDALHMPAIRVHLLAPCARAGEGRPVVTTERQGDGLAVTVRLGDTTDVLLCSASGVGALNTHGVAFTGELLHARISPDGELDGALAVQARRVAWRDEERVRTD